MKRSPLRWMTSKHTLLVGYFLLFLAAGCHFGCQLCECMGEQPEAVQQVERHAAQISFWLLGAALLHMIGYGILTGVEAYHAVRASPLPQAIPNHRQEVVYDEYDELEMARMMDDGCPNVIE